MEKQHITKRAIKDLVSMVDFVTNFGSQFFDHLYALHARIKNVTGSEDFADDAMDNINAGNLSIEDFTNAIINEEDKEELIPMAEFVIKLESQYSDHLYALHARIKNVTGSERFADDTIYAIDNDDFNLNNFIDALDLQF